MKFFLSVIVIFLTGFTYAQKDTFEIIEAGEIKKIRIDTDEAYLISITTANTQQIKISTHSEGEYFNNIKLASSVEGEKLNLTTQYPQRLTGGYDKLSAHKVFSLEIELIIPKHLEVIVNSNIASLSSSGAFKSLHADLNQGYCNLIDFHGIAVVNTFTGNISVETNRGDIQAYSRNGEVKIPDFIPGLNPIKLNSIDGDILVRKN